MCVLFVHQPIVHLCLSRGYCQLQLCRLWKELYWKKEIKSFQSSDQIWSRLDILKLLLLILLRLLILQLYFMVKIEWKYWSFDNKFVMIFMNEHYEQLMFDVINYPRTIYSNVFNVSYMITNKKDVHSSSLSLLNYTFVSYSIQVHLLTLL